MIGNLLPKDLLKELRKLQNGQSSLEKDLNSDLSSKKQTLGEMKDLDITSQNVEFADEKTKIIAKLMKIGDCINHFKLITDEARDSRSRKIALVIDSVSKAMEDVEAQISSFKSTQLAKFDELAAEEKVIDLEVNAVEKRIESWLRNPNYFEEEDYIPAKIVSSDRDIIKDLPPEIAQFQLFVDENGGKNGGWESEDQEVFLRHWSAFKEDGQLVNIYRPLLPVKSEAEIAEHIAWYRKYNELQAVKKAAIARWKEEKAMQQKEKFEIGLLKERETNDAYAAKRAAQEELIEAERRMRKQQLNAWKVEREIQKLRSEEQRVREEIEREVKAERDRHRNAELKEKVKQLQEEKQRQAEIERKMADERKRIEELQRKARIEASRPSIELRNAWMLEEKNERAQQREAEKLERQMRIKLAAEKLKPSVPSDPCRVLQPTKGWQQRVRSAEPSVNRNMPASVVHIPHRAVPSWRQGP